MKSFFRKAGVVLLKFLGVVFFIALFAIVATSVSPVSDRIYSIRMRRSKGWIPFRGRERTFILIHV